LTPSEQHAPDRGASPAYADSDFMRACRRQPVRRTPVWFMRQAGRYMPEYRAIKERATFLQMCKTPDLAVEVTLQPVRAFELDAAILFSDILISVEAMGVGVEFNPGPQIPAPVRTRADVERLRIPDPEEAVPFVLEAVRRLRRELPAHLPLIGFCGAPWTLANYVVEGGGAKEFVRMKQLCYEDPATADLLLEKLAAANAAYLRAQVAAGAQAVQIFDTWAGILDPDDYRRWALPFVQKMVRAVQADGGAPVIYFARDAGSLLPYLSQSGADVLSLDWRVPLDHARATFGAACAVQGNLDPAALFAPWDELRRRADRVLSRAGETPGHIFNLGHGILVGTPVEQVRRLAAHVHESTAKRS
jgi:uroporphyrinogen decarboxylase